MVTKSFSSKHKVLALGHMHGIIGFIMHVHFRFQSFAATNAPAAVANNQYPDFFGVVGAIVPRPDRNLFTRLDWGSIATAV